MKRKIEALPPITYEAELENIWRKLPLYINPQKSDVKLKHENCRT